MIAKIMNKMILSQEGSLHDINHLIKVWTYAKTIAELEGMDPEEQLVLEAAAIVHDIACPSLRARYGTSDGKKQELEGPPLARALLKDSGLTERQLERVLYLVGHHHTWEAVDGRDYQILLEADYIVNADESSYGMDNIRNVESRLFRTAAGKALLKGIYGL